MNKYIITIFFLLNSLFSFAFAEESQPAVVTDEPNRIQLSDTITKIPETSLLGLDMSFSKESIPYWGLILGSTWILYNNDEVILRDVQRDGRDMSIGNTDKTKAVLSAGDIDILRLPTDSGSFMYFLGDGWTHGGIAMGFLLNGYYTENNRAYNTGLRLAHGLAVSTIFNQFLKRSFGRESPYVKTEYQGRWRPYPSVSAYQAKTSQYDAMPSGHIMTATLTFTIIKDSYPEYADYITPFEVVWLTALGWEMVNNGVHWASDYPLGIGMGYVFGKAASQLGRDPKSTASNKINQNWMLIPASTPSGDGVSFIYTY